MCASWWGHPPTCTAPKGSRDHHCHHNYHFIICHRLSAEVKGLKIGIAREIGNVWFPAEAVKSFLKMHLFDAAKNIIQYTRSNNGQGNDKLDTLIVAGCWNGSPSSWMTSTCQRSITGRTCCTWAVWRRTLPSSSGFSTLGQTFTGIKQPGTEHHLFYI